MLSKLSVKKPYTVIVGILLVIVLGYISFQHMSTDLLPSMNLPYVVVYTPYPGATPEQVETEITRPMEASFATLTDIKKVTSQSRDNVSVVIMQFNDGANMDTALIEISADLDRLKGTWDDDVGAPVALKLNPDMLPVAILSVSRDDMDILELSDYVNDELVPGFEALNGVASATASGVIEQEVDVTIEQSRIDVINSAILRDVDAQLADVEAELNAAQAKISDGRRQLARGRAMAEEQLGNASVQLSAGQNQIAPAIRELSAQRESLAGQRENLAQGVSAMETAMNMTDEEKAAVQAAAQQLAELKAQRNLMESQLTSAQATSDDPLLNRRRDAQAQRDELLAQRNALNTYIDDLKLMDADSLNGDIDRLSGEVAGAEAELADKQRALNAAIAQRDALKAEVEELAARVAALSARTEETPADETTPAPSDGVTTETGDEATPAPSGEATEAPGEAVTPAPSDEAGPTDGPTGTSDAETSDTPGETPPATQPQTEASSETDGGQDGDAKDDTTAPSEESTDAEEGGSTEDRDAAKEGDASAGNSSDESETARENSSSNDNGPPHEDNPSNESEPTREDSASSDSGSSREDSASSDSGSSREDSASSDSGSSREDSASNDSGSTREREASSDSGSTRERETSNDSGSSRESSASGDERPQGGGDAAVDGGEAAVNWNRALAEEESLEALQSRLAAAQSRLAEANAEVSARTAEVNAAQSKVTGLREQLSAKQRALDALTDTSADTASRAEQAQSEIAALDGRIAAIDQEIAGIDAEIASGRGDTALLAQQISAMDARIQAVEQTGVEQAAALIQDPEALSAQYAQAQAGLAEVDAGISRMDEYITKLNSGIIPGGLVPGVSSDTNIRRATAELVSAREEMESQFSQAESMLNKAADEIAKARAEFYEKRDEALEDAGIDGVITVQMVAQLLGAQNMSMPAGYAKQADGDQVLVRVGDKFGSVDEMKRLKLFDLDLDTIKEVRLMDVASVALTDDREDVFTKLDGRDGILLSLEKQSTYSTADVAKTVLAYADTLKQEHPELQIVDLMNQGEYIDIVVQSVLNNLLTGGGLAILILLLFLLDWRPTLTVAFSIPISVVIAFVAMYFSGITLNVLSLSGLALGIGMLVDNSIVSIENIYRLHDEENLPLLRACVEGVKSVAGALFSSTLTTICVFLPIVFVQGMARDLFADMGLTIAYSLLASLLVAMTVVPMMCSYLMRHSKPRKHRIFSGIQAAYGAMLRGALRVKPLVLLAAIALLAFSGMQVTKMGISFMPEVNSRQMSADLNPDRDLSDADQKAQAAAIMDDMLKLNGIQSVGLMQGSSSSILANGNGYSYYIIVDESAGVKNVELARQIDEIGEKHNADLTAQASTMDISMMTGSGISVEITGDDIEVLQQLAKDIAQLARDTEGTKDVDDGLEDAVPELRIVVDKEKAVNESLTVGQVYQFIAQKLVGKTEVSKVTLDGKEMKIQLIEGRNKNLRPEEIQDLEIEVEKEDEVNMVRIGDISTIRDASSLSTISRASQRRMVEVTFQIADGYSANHVSDAFNEKLKAYQMPAGYKAELAGENETVMGIMEDLVWMILVAILLIFLIMVAQFQSFKSPIIVMFTIPLAFTGGLLALLLTKMDLSIVAMLGFLVLSGVVVNNGIVFIDCVNQLRIAGMEKRAALVEAGRQRLRPILMTALTTILGMSTMALGHGTGAEMMQPMAVVSIGGLTYATLMTLFVVPVLYDLFNGREMKAREIQMIREAAGMNGDEVLDDGPAPSAPAPDAVFAPTAFKPTAGPVAEKASAPVAEPAAEKNYDAEPAFAPTVAPVGETAPDPAITPDPSEDTPPVAEEGAPEEPSAKADPEPAIDEDAPPVPVFAPRATPEPKPQKPIRVRLSRR